jgi:hypothetical protein
MAVLLLNLNVYRQLPILKDNWLWEFITCQCPALFFFVLPQATYPYLGYAIEARYLPRDLWFAFCPVVLICRVLLHKLILVPGGDNLPIIHWLTHRPSYFLTPYYNCLY